MVLKGTSMMDSQDLGSKALGRRDTPFRKTVELAVGMSLYRAGYGVISSDIVVGIVGTSDFGDRYPEMCVQQKGRLRPHQFGSSVLNSAIGHCSIVFGLIGPQIMLTNSPANEQLAKSLAIIQLVNERADLMVVCVQRTETSAASTVYSL